MHGTSACSLVSIQFVTELTVFFFFLSFSTVFACVCVSVTICGMGNREPCSTLLRSQSAHNISTANGENDLTIERVIYELWSIHFNFGSCLSGYFLFIFLVFLSTNRVCALSICWIDFFSNSAWSVYLSVSFLWEKKNICVRFVRYISGVCVLMRCVLALARILRFVSRFFDIKIKLLSIAHFHFARRFNITINFRR